MTGLEFILYVKAKLNRIDTAAYEGMENEEVLLFAHNALKSLTLAFDLGMYSHLTDRPTVLNYLATLVRTSAVVPVTVNVATLPKVLKIKSMRVEVIADSAGKKFSGWVPAQDRPRDLTFRNENNPFKKSRPNKPIYTLLNENTIEFLVDDTFTCGNCQFDYLEYPDEILEDTNIEVPYIEELQDKTVTLILENLESRRLATQPQVTRS